jgi:dihydroneopterin aldolase
MSGRAGCIKGQAKQGQPQLIHVPMSLHVHAASRSLALRQTSQYAASIAASIP